MQRRLSVVLGIALPTGCVDYPGDTQALPDADYASFVEEVEPLLTDRCGLAVCHGTPDRPLGLFVPPHNRLDGSGSEPLTNLESSANFDRTRSFLVGLEDAALSPLLTEPLAQEAGGSFHEPGPLFNTVVDDEYQVLLTWAEDALRGVSG